MGKIDFVFETEFELENSSVYTKWIIGVIGEENQIAGRLMYTFCTDAQLLEMNRTFLQHDYFTDILTFPVDDPGKVSGEIFISVDRVQENASIHGTSEMEEMRRVMIHGVLHLLGYEDNTSDQKIVMRDRENTYMKMFHVKH